MSATALPPPATGPDTGPNARLLALADQCVLCGACLPHCPTYALERHEAESPRGRIMLMKGLAEGRIGADPAGIAHLDHCLACRHCERVCPAHVAYGELLQLGREAQRERVAPGLRQWTVEWLLQRRRALAAAVRLAHGLARLLPGPWRRLPGAPARRAWIEHTAPHAVPRGRVALFAGCFGELHEQATLEAATRLLTGLGWQVDVPRAQTCCGAARRHAGGDVAQEGARNRAAFGGIDTVLTLASGCHETIAHALSTQAAVRDAIDFLHDDTALASLRFRAATERVALHLPCTQRNLLRNGARTEALLRRVPGLDLVRLPDNGCCGAAGSHMLLEPARADALRAPLLEALRASGATTLVSANIGCRLHLGVAAELRVIHPLHWLAEHLA